MAMRERTLRLGTLLLSAFALLVLPTRGQKLDMTHAATAANSTAVTKSDDARPELQHRPRYTIQRSDSLNIGFPLSPEYNQTITVQPDGYVSLMGAGSIQLEGMNLDQAQGAIRNAYVKAKVLRDPLVTVDLKDFQRPYFSVNGQVGKPGQYELRRDTTLTEALAIAGGITGSSRQQVFLFHRISSGWAEVKCYDIKNLLHGKSIEDPHVEAGDMLFVPENFITKFKKYVPYSFGTYFNPSATTLGL
jgi:polysaccharide export outer membrane protein